MKVKHIKYKEGIDSCGQLAVSKIDGRQFMYKENNLMNIKGYLTKSGIQTKYPLTYFDLIPNPYKGMPKSKCRLCHVSYKDATNYCGVLTSHINKCHNLSIEQYLSKFPEESHLFKSHVQKDLRNKELEISEDNRILCPLCNKHFKRISVAHTSKVHGMGIEEFVTNTGVTQLMSIKEKSKYRDKYYSNDGLLSKTKGIPRFSVKDFIKQVDYHTYDIDTLLLEGVHFIYKLTSPTGRCYIGRTVNFFNRMYEHDHDAKAGRKDYVLYRAIRKHGWENFVKEIIDICPNKETAVKKELEWIEKFDSYENGYNSTKKTEGGFDWSKHKGTEKYDNYISTIKKQRKGQFTLKWFQDKYGVELGLFKFEEKLDQLRKGRKQINHTT